MKPMSEIIKIVLEVYKKEKHTGLCYSAHVLYIGSLLTIEEEESFYRYLHRSLRGKRIFYTCLGDTTYSRSQFAWNTRDRNARIKWCEKNIVRNLALENGLRPNKVYIINNREVTLVGVRDEKCSDYLGVVLKTKNEQLLGKMLFHDPINNTGLPYKTVLTNKTFGVELHTFKELAKLKE